MATETLGVQVDVTALGRRTLTAVAAVFLVIGWALYWLTPPALIAGIRALQRAVVWCTAAGRVGWQVAREQARSER